MAQRYKTNEHLIKLRRTANAFITKKKARRRESLLRPFLRDYLGFLTKKGEHIRNVMEQHYFSVTSPQELPLLTLR